MDAIAALLREYGRHAFDMDGVSARTTAERCEQWVRRSHLRAPRPESDDTAQTLSIKQRDWRGACQFFSAHRRQENPFVGKYFDEVRPVL